MDYEKLGFNELINSISSIESAPSGGSVIAMAASEASALATMIVSYSINNKKLKLFKGEFINFKKDLEKLTVKFTGMVDEDINNFKELKSAYSYKVNSAEDRENKDKLLSEGSIKANKVPLEIITDCFNVVEVLERLKLTVSESLACDVGVCASLIKSAISSCHMTIMSNLTNIKDEEYVNKCLETLNRADLYHSKLDSIVNDIIDTESSKLNIEISRDDS